MRKCASLKDSGAPWWPACERPAVAKIGDRWYCAEHYDGWLRWYRMMFDKFGGEFYGRILKEHR